MTKTNFEPSFDPCYVQGYTAALQDVLKVIREIQPDLKYHKRKQNAKTYEGILQCMIENRRNDRFVCEVHSRRRIRGLEGNLE